MTAQNSSFKLSNFRVFLSGDGKNRPLEIAPDFWERYAEQLDATDARMLSAVFATESEQLHPSSWEMHPQGDELLCMCSGALDLVLEEKGGDRTVELRAGTAYVVPPGTWHRLLLREPGLLIAITVPGGTELRDV